jgi:hypothetical protein
MVGDESLRFSQGWPQRPDSWARHGAWFLTKEVKVSYQTMLAERQGASSKRQPMTCCFDGYVLPNNGAHTRIRKVKEKMSFRNKAILICGLVSALGLGMSASLHAGTLNFDPTGNGGGTGHGFAIGGIDPAPGNALAVGVNPVTLNKAFDLYFQANLSALLDNNGNPIGNNGGLNSTYFLSTVAGFGEKITGVGNNGDGTTTVTFQTAPAPHGENYVQLYINNAPGNNATGQGFNSGTLILQGVVSSIPVGGASFTADPNAKSFPKLDDDGKPPNQYPGVKSVEGSGSTELFINVTYQNPNYLYGAPIASIDFNTSNKTPFEQVEPGSKVQGQTPNVGTLNGGFTGAGGGPDVLFQSDANGSFLLVPEPSTMALSAVALGGLVLMGLVRRRRATRT